MTVGSPVDLFSSNPIRLGLDKNRFDQNELDEKYRSTARVTVLSVKRVRKESILRVTLKNC